MIDLVREVLLDAGLVGPSIRLCYNVYFLRSRIVHVFIDDRFAFAVKMAKNTGIEHEYQSTVRAYAAYGWLVPEPLVVRAIDDLNIAVWRGLRHVPIGRRLRPSQMAIVRHGLAHYFSRGLERLRISDPVESHSERVSRLLPALRSRIPSLKLLSDEIVPGSALDDMAHVYQHGDFWLGNLGIATRRLIVFDWEDFGVAKLHGHDLGVFIVSALQFDAGAIRRLAEKRQPVALDAIIADFCAATDIHREVFFALLPVFLTEFLALKLNRGYSSLAINLVADLLMKLSAQGPK